MEAGSKAAYSSFEYQEANYALLLPPSSQQGVSIWCLKELKELLVGALELFLAIC